MLRRIVRRTFLSSSSAAAAAFLYLIGKQSFGELGFGAAPGNTSPNITTAAPVTRSPTFIYLNGVSPQVTSVGFTAGEALTITNGATVAGTGNFIAFNPSNNSILEISLSSGALPANGATITGTSSGYSVTYPGGSLILVGSYEPDTWTAVALRFTTALGIKGDGTLWATGYNGYNQILAGNTNNVCQWTQVGTAKNWVAIDPGDEFIAALDSNGDVWTQGNNAIAAQCHNGTGASSANVTALYNTSTTSSVFHPRIVSISTGGSQLTPYEIIYQGTFSNPTWKGRMLVHDTTAGLLYFSNESGTLAVGSVTGVTSGRTLTVTNVTKTTPKWKSLYVGHRYAMVIDSNGRLMSWGNNGGDTECGRASNSPGYPSSYPLVNGGAPPYLSDSNQPDYCSNPTQDLNCWPVNYPSTGSLPWPGKWLNVFPGAYNCFALSTDTNLYGWGKNTDYEMGATMGGQTATPPHVIPCATGHTWINANAGDYHCGLIRDDGALFMGGKNANGQLGNGSTAAITDFVQVPNPVVNGVTGYWVAVSCGSTHTLAIDNRGYLWGWGDNSTFQLGQVGSGGITANNQTTAANTYTSPILIDSSRKYTTISSGKYASLALSIT